jgi:glutamate-1-semialdehyde 2,1-aminomutase
VRSVLAGLGRPRPEAETAAALQDEFIRFTNDLDRARGQDFASLCPRLHQGLIAAGLDFRGKYRFARDGGPAAAGG